MLSEQRSPLTVYIGRAGDRNPRGMRGAVMLGQMISRQYGLKENIVGTSYPPLPGGWQVQLAAALSDLRLLSSRMGEVLTMGMRPLTVMGRCAASIATLPEVVKRYPEAVIVWFDAHGDSNIPTEGAGAEINYLGGMVLTGVAGRWKTGLGNGLALNQVILTGSRDLDPPEKLLIERGEISLIGIGRDLPVRLREAINGRKVYVHIDCDVLEAGLLSTEYQSPGGLSFTDLTAACAMLAEEKIIGVEIAEFEAEWSDGKPGEPAKLLKSLEPLLEKIMRPVLESPVID